jgi:hypothetical protein
MVLPDVVLSVVPVVVLTEDVLPDVVVAGVVVVPVRSQYRDVFMSFLRNLLCELK